MTQYDRAYILNTMQATLGTSLTKIARAGAMGSLLLTSQDGKEYVMHLQCAFRFRSGSNILMANFDMFEPTAETENASSFDWTTWSDHGWDTQGLNRYDAWALNLQKRDNEYAVEAIEVNEVGDLIIHFCDDMVLEIFNNCALEECWRLFEPLTDTKHLVVTGRGLER